MKSEQLTSLDELVKENECHATEIFDENPEVDYVDIVAAHEDRFYNLRYVSKTVRITDYILVNEITADEFLDVMNKYEE